MGVLVLKGATQQLPGRVCMLATQKLSLNERVSLYLKKNLIGLNFKLIYNRFEQMTIQ
jgi:hypothetical protein